MGKKKAAKKKTKTSAAKKGKKPEAETLRIPRDRCPECGSYNILHSKVTGQTICQDCAAIFEPLDPESEKKLEKAWEGEE